jgi:adenosine deaminase
VVRSLGIEIHAGERCGADSVWRALEYGFATRIGHGVSAFSDPVLVDHLAAQKIHLEFCVTSNCKLGVIPSPSHHPLMRAWERGIPFSINTDDPGPFECSMLSECELIQRTFGLNEAHFQQIHHNTLANRFISVGSRVAPEMPESLARRC